MQLRGRGVKLRPMRAAVLLGMSTHVCDDAIEGAWGQAQAHARSSYQRRIPAQIEAGSKTPPVVSPCGRGISSVNNIMLERSTTHDTTAFQRRPSLAPLHCLSGHPWESVAPPKSSQRRIYRPGSESENGKLKRTQHIAKESTHNTAALIKGTAAGLHSAKGIRRWEVDKRRGRITASLYFSVSMAIRFSFKI